MSFQFRQFYIDDHRCAQRVGTDGVLLGAWAPIGEGRILDVGTGSGLIAIMLAQRTQSASIIGIDIDADSIEQAQSNASRTQWADRITMMQADFLTWQTEDRFDAIVSNPPFFERALECPDARRSKARHTSALPLPQLARHSSTLLNDNGTLSVILPYDATESFIFQCQLAGLLLSHRCDIRTVERKTPKRSLLHFIKAANASITHSTLTLLSPDGTRTPQHQELTQDFYIK